MRRCDWRGPICTTNKDPERLTGWDFTTGGRTIMLEAAAVTLEDGIYRVNGKPVAQTERLSPIIETGSEIVVRRGCAKRAGHRGHHGWYPGQRTAMKATTATLAAATRLIWRTRR